MRKFWNLFLLTTAVLAIGLFLTLQYFLRKKIETVAFDRHIDKVDLQLCDEERVLQYYMVSTDYNGGKRAIKSKLFPRIQKDQISFGSFDGNITIRFIVNCKGQIGLFRARVIDQALKTAEIDEVNAANLIALVSQLDNWQVAVQENGEVYDAYYSINFKVRNGFINDIF
ncbi:MAG: hypothetical protein ACJAT1_000667 [Marivirga sp.]